MIIEIEERKMKTMKKICVLMLCVVMALSAFGCAKTKGKGRSGGSSANAAEDGTEDFKTEKAGDGYRITGLTETGKTKETVVIPAGYEICGSLSGGVVKHVTFESDDDAELITFFANSDTLETCVLPANLSKLCQFTNCSALQEITIPKNVTKIPASCFANCDSLETVEILGDVTELGNQAFRNCKSLKTINLPDSIVLVDHSCFKGCENVSELTLPKNLKTIGSLAFANIGLKTLTVPEEMELEKWDSAAFIQKEPYTVRVKEGSWADENFEKVFAGHAVKEYY